MPYDDSGVEFEIRADDRKARPAIDRTNSSLERIEKTATSAGRAMHGAFLAAGTAVTATAAAIEKYRGKIMEITAATALAGGTTHQLVNGWRALRMVISPSIITGATIALGVLAEKIISVTRARYALMQVEGMAAAKAGRPYSTIATYGATERMMGLEPGSFEFKGFSPDAARGAVAAILATKDPVERARLAVESFGESAAKVLPLLDSRFQSNLDHAYALSMVLSTKTRRSLTELGESLPHPTQRLRELADAFRYAAEASRIAITKMVADFYEYDKLSLRNPLSMSRGITARERAAGAFGMTYDPKTGRLISPPPQLLEIEAGMAGRMPTMGSLAPDVPSFGGAMFPGLSIAQSYLSSREGLQGRLSSLQGRKSALAGGIGTSEYPTLVAQALIPIDREMKVIEARLKVLDKQDEMLRKEEALIEKMGTFEAGDLGDIPDYVTGRRRAMPTLMPGGRLVGGIMEPPAFVVSQKALDDASKGITEAESDRARAVLAGMAERQKMEESLGENALNRQIRILELMTKPGGELETAEKVYQLRMKASKTQEDSASAAGGLEIKRLEILRKNFDEIRSSFEGLFDAAFSGARNFWDAVRRMALSVFLTPIKREMGNWVAGMLTGRSGASGGASGGILNGMFGGLFGGRGGTASTLTAENAVAGAYQMGPMGMGLGGSMGGMGGGLGSFGAMGGGAGGWQGMVGNGLQMAGVLGGASLATSGAKRGGLLGAGMLGGGAALTALALGFGPYGILAIGAVALGAGLIRMLWKSAEQKVIDKVQEIYRVRIDKPLAQQIVAMAKQAYGGNLDMAIRAPQGRELIELYAMATGQNMMGLAAKQLPTTMSQSRGVISQQPSYYNGSVYVAPTATTGLGGGGSSMTVSLDPQATREFLSGRMAQTIVQNPRAVATASLEAGRQSVNRRELAAQALQPGLVLA